MIKRLILLAFMASGVSPVLADNMAALELGIAWGRSGTSVGIGVVARSNGLLVHGYMDPKRAILAAGPALYGRAGDASVGVAYVTGEGIAGYGRLAAYPEDRVSMGVSTAVYASRVAPTYRVAVSMRAVERAAKPASIAGPVAAAPPAVTPPTPPVTPPPAPCKDSHHGRGQGHSEHGNGRGVGHCKH